MLKPLYSALGYKLLFDQISRCVPGEPHPYALVGSKILDFFQDDFDLAKKPTRQVKEQSLAESLWWWRHCRFAQPADPMNTGHYLPNFHEQQDWINGMEEIAHGWELIRRFNPSEIKLPPFYKIGGFIAENLRVRLIARQKQSVRKITTESSPVGWSDPDADGWRWNLSKTKDALRHTYAMQFLSTQWEISDFFAGKLSIEELQARRTQRRKEKPSIVEHMRWIEKQAKKHHRKLATSLHGQRTKPISWRQVEVVDLARYKAIRADGTEKLLASDRTMKSKALRAASKLFLNYIAALYEVFALRGFLFQYDRESRTRFERIILGGWKPPKNNW
jgi:hypothetical protein